MISEALHKFENQPKSKICMYLFNNYLYSVKCMTITMSGAEKIDR